MEQPAQQPGNLDIDAQDLEIYRHIPTAARATVALSKVLTLLSTGFTGLVFVMAGTVGLAWATSRIGRAAAGNIWFTIGAVGVLTILWLAYGWVVSQKGVFLVRLILGPPEFGKLGGLPSRQFRLLVRLSKEMDLTFDESDSKILGRLIRLELEATETKFRRQLEQVQSVESISDEDWQKFWDANILHHRVEGTNLEDILKGYVPSILVLPLSNILRLTSPLRLVYLASVVWIVSGWLIGPGSFLLALQVSLFLSFAISSLVFMVFMLHLGAPIPVETEKQLDLFPEELHEEAIELGEKEVVLKDVKLTDRYFSLIRDHMAMTLLRGTPIDLLGLCVAVGVALGMSLLFAPGPHGDTILAYARLLLALPGILGVLFVGHYLAFLILRGVKSFLAPILTGAVTAGVPVMFEYVTTGSVSTDSVTIVAGVGSAMLAGVLSGITSRIKGATQEA